MFVMIGHARCGRGLEDGVEWAVGEGRGEVGYS